MHAEEAVLFPGLGRYYALRDLDEMREAFCAFDRTMIHEKYERVHDSLSTL